MSKIERIYLDYNATAPLCDAARAAVLEALLLTGNPSSVHAEGRAARAMVEKARRQLAQAVGVGAKQVIFTSGASEAATQALSPEIRCGGTSVRVSRLYVSEVEHPCVLSGGRFARDAVETLPVLRSGLLDLDALENALSNHDATTGPAMVAVQLANSETGLIQPMDEIAEIIHRHNAFLTVDAVQALGKIDVDIASMRAHFVLFSSHKIGGPQGAGALVLGDASISPEPMIKGGGQENFQRAGTENVAAIAGFGAAAATIGERLLEMDTVAALRDSIEAGIDTICAEAGNKAGIPVFFAVETGDPGIARLPNTSCFAVPGIKAETALIAMDLEGIAISSGSACSSGKVRRSHVLEAMGVDDELAGCALRVSAGPQTTKADAERFLGAFRNIASRAA